MSKQRNKKKQERKANRNPQMCGHGRRHRNKRGCVICRHKNGATVATHEPKQRKARAIQVPTPVQHALQRAGLA